MWAISLDKSASLIQRLSLLLGPQRRTPITHNPPLTSKTRRPFTFNNHGSCICARKLDHSVCGYIDKTKDKRRDKSTTFIKYFDNTLYFEIPYSSDIDTMISKCEKLKNGEITPVNLFVPFTGY